MRSQRARAYPFLPLREAVELVLKFLEVFPRGILTEDQAARLMNYATVSKGGVGRRKLVALKYYGFIEMDSGLIKITDAAKQLHGPADGEESREILRAGFAKPALFLEIIEAVRADPTILDRLSDELARKFGVTKKAAPQVAAVFLASAEYAGALSLLLNFPPPAPAPDTPQNPPMDDNATDDGIADIQDDPHPANTPAGEQRAPPERASTPVGNGFSPNETRTATISGNEYLVVLEGSPSRDLAMRNFWSGVFFGGIFSIGSLILTAQEIKLLTFKGCLLLVLLAVVIASIILAISSHMRARRNQSDLLYQRTTARLERLLQIERDPSGRAILREPEHLLDNRLVIAPFTPSNGRGARAAARTARDKLTRRIVKEFEGVHVDVIVPNTRKRFLFGPSLPDPVRLGIAQNARWVVTGTAEQCKEEIRVEVKLLDLTRSFSLSWSSGDTTSLEDAVHSSPRGISEHLLSKLEGSLQSETSDRRPGGKSTENGAAKAGPVN